MLRNQEFLFSHIITSLTRFVIGFISGSILGIILALLTSIIKPLDIALMPVIRTLAPVPALAFIPFVMLWFGLGYFAPIFLMIWASSFVMIITTYDTIKNIPQVYKWAAMTLGANKISVYFKVVFRWMIPELTGALRVASISCLNMLLLAEFNRPNDGIGSILIRGYRYARTEMLFLGIIIVVILAVIIDLLLTCLVRVSSKWQDST